MSVDDRHPARRGSIAGTQDARISLRAVNGSRASYVQEDERGETNPRPGDESGPGGSVSDLSLRRGTAGWSAADNLRQEKNIKLINRRWGSCIQTQCRPPLVRNGMFPTDRPNTSSPHLTKPENFPVGPFEVLPDRDVLLLAEFRIQANKGERL